MVAEVDEARAEAGCPALRVDPRLTLASRAHSEDMQERSYYSHVNPDGEGPGERAAAEGYTARVGENLSEGMNNAQQVVRSWEDGGDERDRLLDCSYTSVGVGTERGGLLGLKSWWTLMLGTD
nr:CAP domain-containing protein [Jiangella mangrovi]